MARSETDASQHVGYVDLISAHDGDEVTVPVPFLHLCMAATRLDRRVYCSFLVAAPRSSELSAMRLRFLPNGSIFPFGSYCIGPDMPGNATGLWFLEPIA